MAELIDGREIALGIQQEVNEAFQSFKIRPGEEPKLVALLVGDNKEAKLYAKAQKKAADSIGVLFVTLDISEDASHDDIIDKIEELNRDSSVTAVLVQHPLPGKFDHNKIISKLRPEKDAEGVHPANLGKLFRKEADIVPCTPGAVMRILKSQGVDLYGKDVVIIGHSPIVGKPLSLMMLNKTATTTVCHIGTAEKGDITSYSRKADVLVVAVGRPGIVAGDWIKEGAIVIDVGINSRDGKIVGDVCFDEACKKASMITPVPGGVGPVTVSMLMRNVLEAYKAQHGKF